MSLPNIIIREGISMKKDLLTGKSGKIGLIIKALLLFAAVFAAAVMLFALIMYIFAAGFKYSALFATLSAASGAFAAAFYLSGKNGSRGWLTGAAVGGIYGRVISLKEETIVIESASDHSKLTIARWALQTNLTVHDDTVTK